MTVFLIDAFVALFPSIILAIIFGAGLLKHKHGGNPSEWWIAGTVLHALYSLGTISSKQPNYAAVIIGTVVVIVFYFPMHKKAKSDEKH